MTNLESTIIGGWLFSWTLLAMPMTFFVMSISFEGPELQASDFISGVEGSTSEFRNTEEEEKAHLVVTSENIFFIGRPCLNILMRAVVW